MGYRISYAALSHRGNFRPRNQDNFLCAQAYLPSENRGTPTPLTGRLSSGKRPLFGVFDGMGGEEKGEVAAFLAAEAAARTRIGPDPREDLRHLCLRANDAIYDCTAALGLRAMGTTAALVTFADREAHLCNLGDSRIFRLRSGQLTQLSQDHVLPGVRGRKPPLTQYLGMSPEETALEPYVITERIRGGDLYLLCSDGLTDMLPEDEIRDILRAAPPADAAAQLLRQALSRGGKDNITLILCKISRFSWIFY